MTPKEAIVRGLLTTGIADDAGAREDMREYVADEILKLIDQAGYEIIEKPTEKRPAT